MIPREQEICDCPETIQKLTEIERSIAIIEDDLKILDRDTKTELAQITDDLRWKQDDLNSVYLKNTDFNERVDKIQGKIKHIYQKFKLRKKHAENNQRKSENLQKQLKIIEKRQKYLFFTIAMIYYFLLIIIMYKY